MSWKLFWQIVLLMAIATIILLVLKCSLYYMHKAKYGMMRPQMSQPYMEGMGNRGMMMKGKGMMKDELCK